MELHEVLSVVTGSLNTKRARRYVPFRISFKDSLFHENHLTRCSVIAGVQAVDIYT